MSRFNVRIVACLISKRFCGGVGVVNFSRNVIGSSFSVVTIYIYFFFDGVKAFSFSNTNAAVNIN